MYRFVETLCLKDGVLIDAECHNMRLNVTRAAFFAIDAMIDVVHVLEPYLPDAPGVFKCRIVYGADVHSVAVSPYEPKAVRSLRLVCGDGIDYRYKYDDRSALNALLEQRGDADDILIVKDGLLTDTSYSNVVFWDGDAWCTPDRPLLDGVQRQRLLANGMIRERRLTPADLDGFSEARLINTMLDLETGPRMPIGAIARS